MIIAVSCGVRETKTSSGMLDTNSLVTYFNELINESNGTMIIIPPQRNLELSNLIPSIDGLVITGGGDIDPSLYNQENEYARNISQERDTVEMQLLSLAEENNIRTMAICRGHQLLNIYKGGTLVQDIDSIIDQPLSHVEVNEKTSQHIHDIKIKKNTKLYSILKKETLGVNSIHHQCIDKLGNNLIVSAKSDDGVIEGIEIESGWDAIGIQGHPEYLGNDLESKILFDWIVEG